MSALPALTPVTSPALFTVATLAFEDAQVACDVTVCVVLFDSVAVAVNCDVAPRFGAFPLTLTVVTVGAVFVVVFGGDVGPGEKLLPLHAHGATASQRRRERDTIRERTLSAGCTVIPSSTSLL